MPLGNGCGAASHHEEGGDGSPDTVVNLNAGIFTFAIAVPVGTYTDDPNGPVQTIHRPIGVKVEEVANPGNFLNNGSLSVDVNNVIPIATLSTLDNDLNEGESLTLNIGAKVDPGTDTVSAYRINWGDGENDVYTSNMSTPEVRSAAKPVICAVGVKSVALLAGDVRVSSGGARSRLSVADALAMLPALSMAEPVTV